MPQAKRGTHTERKVVRAPVLPAPVVLSPGILETGEHSARSAPGTLGP